MDQNREEENAKVDGEAKAPEPSTIPEVEPKSVPKPSNDEDDDDEDLGGLF